MNKPLSTLLLVNECKTFFHGKHFASSQIVKRTGSFNAQQKICKGENVTLDQIKAFDAVVKHGSIRAASDKLYKTPPTISSAIKCLEEDIGITLFCRNTYRLTLSEEGKIVHLKVLKVLQSVTELNSFAVDQGKLSQHPISAEFSAGTPDEVKTRILQVITEEFPQFTLQCTQRNDVTDNKVSSTERLP